MASMLDAGFQAVRAAFPTCTSCPGFCPTKDRLRVDRQALARPGPGPQLELPLSRTNHELFEIEDLRCMLMQKKPR